MNIIFFGPPGSGKGTQAQALSDRETSESLFKGAVRHISTGDLFRRHLQQKTALGLSARAFIDRGALVPDSVTSGMAEEALREIPLQDHIIFDGFPRSLPQAKALAEMLGARGQALDLAVFFDVSDETALERLSGRLWAPRSGRIYHIKNNPPKNPGRCDQTGEALAIRKDDQKQVILSRLKAYRKSTLPLLEHYEREGVLRRIDGGRPPKAIRRDILQLAFPGAVPSDSSAGSSKG